VVRGRATLGGMKKKKKLKAKRKASKKRRPKPEDFNQAAFRVVRESTKQ
jgi:hypothetical protein